MTINNITVAMIGLGRIGSGIAKNVQASGCRLLVYNRTPQKAQPFVAAGALAARTPREAAFSADVVITSLMGDQSVLDILSGSDGILAGMRAGAIHIGTSTISPTATARIAALHHQHGSHYVAAPVLGRPDAAAAGKLMTLVAAPRDILERARPVLQAYTQRLIELGDDPSRAASMKLTANFFAAGLLELVGQAFTFADKSGVLAPMNEMLRGFLAPMGEYLDRMAERRYDHAGFTLDAGLKDLQLILQAAGEVQVPLPLASLIRDKCLAAQAHGLGQQDWCVFTEISRLEAGQPPR